MKFKTVTKVATAAIVSCVATAQVFAASMFDTATKAAVATSLTDIEDTAKDAVLMILPVIIILAAIKFGPKFIKRLTNSL